MNVRASAWSLCTRYVPWALPPYYSNPDEQTLLNDVLISSISGTTTYGGSTAKWEVRLGGTSKATDFDAQAAPQQQQYSNNNNNNVTTTSRRQATPQLQDHNKNNNSNATTT